MVFLGTGKKYPEVCDSWITKEFEDWRKESLENINGKKHMVSKSKSAKHSNSTTKIMITHENNAAPRI